MARFDSDFFGIQFTPRYRAALQDADPLVLFIGAGVAKSQDFPTWNELLRALVERAASEHKSLPDDVSRREFVEVLLASRDAPIVGSVVRGRFPTPDSFYDALYEAVYPPGDRRRPPTSNFIRAIWRLVLVRHQVGLATVVITTNYDDSLETAFRIDEETIARAQAVGVNDVRPVYVQSQLRFDDDTSSIPIYHIHGYVPRDSNDRPVEQEFVLSAYDYARDWTRHWAHGVITRYMDSQWLFVGMSFQDSHISFYLSHRKHTHDGKAQPIGIYSLQGQPWTGLNQHAKLALYRAENSRLDELGMIALPTSFYFQDAQVLHELALSLGQGEQYIYYTDRRQQWHEAFRTLKATPDVRALAYESLAAVRDLIESYAPRTDEGGESAPQEAIKVELWARNVDTSTLEQFASSEVLHRSDDEGRVRVPSFALHGENRPAVLGALLTGAPVRGHGSGHSRWKSFLAVPVSLHEPPWNGLPVGALLFAGTEPWSSTVLRTERSTLNANMDNWLSGLQSFLDPTLETATQQPFLTDEY